MLNQNVTIQGPNWFITNENIIYIQDDYDKTWFILDKKRFSGTDWSKIKKKLENKEKIITYKNRENKSKSRKLKGICVNCKKEVENRDQIGRCKKCHDEWYKKHNSSDKMKEKAAELGNKYKHLIINDSKTEEGRKRRTKTMIDLHQNNEFIQQHVKNQAIKNLNLINNVLAKDADWLATHPRFINPIYERDDTGRIIKVRDQLFDDYCKQFIINSSVEFSDFYRINVDISESHPTLPTLAWQQLITDKCTELNEGHWLVYIKYYLDSEGNSKPLVIGKTGNNIVNTSGTDLCFNYIDKNQGAARQFLEENGFKWNTEFIDFKCFRTEEEALEFEYNLLQETGLFGG